MADQSVKTPQAPRLGGRFGRGPVEKPKDFKGTMQQLLHYLAAYRIKFVFVFFFASMGALFTIVGPKVLAGATNQIVDDYVSIKAYKAVHGALPKGIVLPKGTTGATLIDMMSAKEKNAIPDTIRETIRTLDMTTPPVFHYGAILTIILWLCVLYALSAVFTYVQSWMMATITQRVTKRFRSDISRKINRLPLSYFDKTTYGEVLSRITNDVDTVGQTLNQSLSQIITSTITLIGITIMMLSISWVLTLVALLVVPLSFIFLGFIMKYSQVQFIRQQNNLGDINGHIEEVYAGHDVVKVFNGEAVAEKTFHGINRQLYKSAWRAQFLSGILHPLMTFVGNLGYMAVAVVGGYMAIQNSLRIGDIQAFIQYVQQFNQPIIQTANIMNILQSTAAAAERVFTFLEEKEEPAETDTKPLPKVIHGAIQFDHVSFGYDPEEPVIRDLSLNVAAGQRVAIVGPTGAGKTTIVNLLMRFYDVDDGVILIDGNDTREFKRSDVRQLFGMVLQDTWLCSGTIRENLAYGRDDATMEDIERAVKKAHLNHLIHALPGGYEMRLDEETTNISQGERQLFTIARAMVADAPMLILDEATSAVDTRTEALIQQAMERLMKGKTSFVIAHRLSTIRDADLILMLKDGAIVEQGTHEQLLANRGAYAELYNSQFAGQDT